MRSFCLEVSGEYACFTRPEMKVERVSYDVMTPSAARSVFEAILWKPAIRWEVRRIEVLKPIRWISVRRNEVASKVSVRNAQTAMGAAKGNLALYVEEDRQQRAGLFLRDVAYRIHADLVPVGDDAHSNPVMTFRLHNDGDLICQRPAVVSACRSEGDTGEATAVCLVTGEPAATERLHTAIKGVWGAQSSGATLVSFNLDAFASFNKEQGDNAPVSPFTAFAYTTALSHLLDRNSRQRFQVGDASTVFWAQKEDADAESVFAAIFGEQDDPDARTELVRGVLSAVQSGQFDGGRGENRFYVLGLAPNAARVSVRFWYAAPLHEIAQRIRQWFDDLKMVRSSKDPEYPSLFRLLAACAQQGKADNIPPNLGGDIMRAILSGGPFPATWLNAAVQRCRAEQNVTYLRAAAIKACLNRSRRSSDFSFVQEFSDMLDHENTSPAYRLGRLFAVLEKIQEEANPGLNATIRERYYGAASSTPVAVFTTLLRLKNHHLAKLTNRGRAVNFERLLGEIMGGIDDFPKHLNLPDQGRFSLGYYHQRQDFFSKSTQSDESTQGDSK